MKPLTGPNRISSSEEQAQNRERFRREAEALELVRTPEIPIAVFLEEGVEALRAAHLHVEELDAVGMPRELPERLRGYLAGLRGAQAIWRMGTDQHTGELEAAIERAREARREARQALELALRRNPSGQERLARVGDAETLPQLSLVLTQLAFIATTCRPELTAIRVDADELGKRLAWCAESLEEARFVERSQRESAEAKELRDRYYTLTLELLSDLRAYAQFAFRKDRSAHRRQLFLSRYVRERNRKHLRKNRATAGVARAPTTLAPGPGADDTAERPETTRQAA